MKVYVDELPECCSKCPCMNDDIEYGNHCNLICVNGLKLCLDCDDCQHFRHKDCPLETTQSLKQQVRKEVLSELRNMLGDRAELIDFGNGCAEFMFTTYDLQECSKEILDQIEQGETKGE